MLMIIVCLLDYKIQDQIWHNIWTLLQILGKMNKWYNTLNDKTIILK